MIIWNDQFATGSPDIDQQHRMLIFNINHLGWMLTNTNLSRESCEFLIHLTNFLEAYAQKHFRFEEACMERYRCPVHERNKQAHAQFLALLSHFKTRCRAEGFRPQIIQGLHQALASWIQEHILQVDSHLKPCIAAALAPATLAQKAEVAAAGA